MLGLLADVLSLALPVQLLLLASTVLRCCCVAGWRGSSSDRAAKVGEETAKLVHTAVGGPAVK